MVITIRPDAQMQHALDNLAKSTHLSSNEILRAAVLEKWEREHHLAKVGVSANRMLDQWGDVLERLGKA